jgi:hypothetical protein
MRECIWNWPGIPHKGWICIDEEDRGDDHTSCAMCGHYPIRYVHIMFHPDCPCLLEVGSHCAELMSESYRNRRDPGAPNPPHGITESRGHKGKWFYWIARETERGPVSDISSLFDSRGEAIWALMRKLHSL